jgi:chromosomal replication initiator protein
MDVQSGLTPRALKRSMVTQRSTVPEDTDAIERLFHYLETTRPTMAEIKEAVCEFYDVKRDEIEGPSRKCHIVLARHVFCFFAYRYARASLNQIKFRCGHIDHSTVHHAIHRITVYSVTRPLVRDDLDLLRLRICEKMLQRGGASC